VPSTVRFVSKKTHTLPLLQDGRSLGVWGGIAWDRRRSPPPYVTGFMEDLTAYISRTVPGKRFDRIAPPLPPQPIGDGG
jgi:hypothetical protein